MTRFHVSFGLTAAAAVFLATSTANAADIAPAPPTDDWTITIAPYVWAAGLKGDVGILGLKPYPVDMTFGDVLSDLNFAAMGVVDIHNGTWGVFTDVMYTNLSSGESIERIVGGNSVELKAGVDAENFVFTMMGEYRLAETDQVSLDLMAGARLWMVDSDVKVTLKFNGRPIKSLSGSDDATWVDPMVGFRGKIKTDSPVYFTGWGMIGGAGVGSDFAWDVMGGIGYEWTDSFSTVLSYRALGVDYSNDGFVYDVVQHGVALGGVFRF